MPGLAKARLTSSAWAADMPATSMMSWTTLLLPDDDAVAPLQGAPLQGVVVLPGRPVPVALHELRHRAALDADAGPDERHLVGQVQQGARLQALPHLELGGRLEQEDPLGAALVDHVVHPGVLGVYGG